MISDFLQSDAMIFAIAMVGIAVTSVAIARDYLPHDEAGARRAEPVPADPASAVGATSRS